MHGNNIEVAYGHACNNHFALCFCDILLADHRPIFSCKAQRPLGVIMLLDLFEKTLKLPLKSKVVTQPYVDFLASQYQLNHNGFHGIEHWFRVLINARLIAAEAGADIYVVEHFSLLHDVMRKNEKLDILHGNRSAEFALSLSGSWIQLNRLQMQQLTEACRDHSMGRLSKDVTIQVCWDADRLDLGRLGNTPNHTYLSTKIARDENFIKRAIKRSKRGFVNYDFR